MWRRQLLRAAAGACAGFGSGLIARASQPFARESWPAPLRRGSRIAAVAPGTWLEPGDPTLALLRQRCQAKGWQLLTPPELGNRWRWFAGTDGARSRALRQAWLDPHVDAIFCVGAGWGSARLLEQGWVPAPGPRWCVGFSDVSALLLAQQIGRAHV